MAKPCYSARPGGPWTRCYEAGRRRRRGRAARGLQRRRAADRRERGRDARLHGGPPLALRRREAPSLTLVKPDIPPPDETTRAHIRNVNRQPDVARTSYVVIDAQGFWAATMRGVLAGISRCAPRRRHVALRRSRSRWPSSPSACAVRTWTPSRDRSLPFVRSTSRRVVEQACCVARRSTDPCKGRW